MLTSWLAGLSLCLTKCDNHEGQACSIHTWVHNHWHCCHSMHQYTKWTRGTATRMFCFKLYPRWKYRWWFSLWMFLKHLIHISRGMTVCASIPVAVGLDCLTPPSEFECDYRYKTVPNSYWVEDLASRRHREAIQGGDKCSTLRCQQYFSPPHQSWLAVRNVVHAACRFCFSTHILPLWLMNLSNCSMW